MYDLSNTAKRRDEIIKNAILAAERDGYNKVILYSEEDKDYVIIRDFEGNKESWESAGYNVMIGKVKTHYDENEKLKAVFISSKNDRLKEFITMLRNEKLVKKYLYKYTWVSGSCTTVYPIMVWQDEIILQWDIDKNYFNKFIERIVAENSDLIEDGIFVKNDDSCPANIVFKFSDIYKNC